MVKSTNQTSYRFGDNQLEVFPFYLYEVTFYKLTKDLVTCLSIKYYKSDKELKDSVKITKVKNYIIQRSISLIGAPLDFIKAHKLKPYKLKKK